MGRCLVLVVLLAALSLPTAAQTAKTKAPAHRTYVDSIDMSSSQATLGSFIEAYAAADYFEVYMLLSPDAKRDFMTKVFEFNVAQFFPDLPSGESLGGMLREDPQVGEDIIQETFLDGGLTFDRAMQAADDASALPFTIASGAFFSPTFEREDQARYLITGAGEQQTLIISTIKLSNGDWRIERIVWPASDPDARPWGFK